jgi:hypothetical protein
VAAVAVTVAAAGLVGCGGSRSPAASARDGIRSSVDTYVGALAKHDAARACKVITPAYWSATVAQLLVQLPSRAYKNLPSEGCRQALARLFSGSRPASAAPRFALSNVRVNGRIATAHLTFGTATSNGATPNARFVQAPGGVWQIDCCTGSQLVQHPPNLPG